MSWWIWGWQSGCWWERNLSFNVGWLLDDFMNNWDAGIVCVQNMAKRAALWNPPSYWSFKFNVERSASGKSGPAGISGVLCSSRRRYYSCSLRLLVPKVMTKGRWWHSLEALCIFSSALHKSLIVERNSLLGELFWTESVEVSFLPQWDQNIVFLGSVDFHHVGHLANGTADALAWCG